VFRSEVDFATVSFGITVVADRDASGKSEKPCKKNMISTILERAVRRCYDVFK
jgi:hypothetical protein